MSIGYAGVKPPDLNTPVIELETVDGCLVDLYNDCWLDAIVFDAAGVAFNFSTRGGRRFCVLFREVCGLHVTQPP